MPPTHIFWIAVVQNADASYSFNDPAVLRSGSSGRRAAMLRQGINWSRSKTGRANLGALDDALIQLIERIETGALLKIGERLVTAAILAGPRGKSEERPTRILHHRIKQMAFGDRKSARVDFERGIHVYIMAIDGTWRLDCLMIDVSQTGARLHVDGSIEGLDLKEFFLLLSSTGLAYRRCKLVRVAGDQIGVEFLAQDKTRKKYLKRQSTEETV